MYKAKRKSKNAGQPRTYRGKKIEDATKPFSFVVTTQDCKRGKPNDPGKCAAACAIKRTYPGAPIAVYVHRDCTFVEFDNKMVRHKTAAGLRDQTIRYDAAKKFDAGKYGLNRVPPSAIKARGQRHSEPDRVRGDPASPKARSKGLAFRHHVGRKAFHFTTENSDFQS